MVMSKGIDVRRGNLVEEKLNVKINIRNRISKLIYKISKYSKIFPNWASQNCSRNSKRFVSTVLRFCYKKGFF